MKWIRIMLGLCVHKWVIHQEGDIRGRSAGIIAGKVYFLRCEKCGGMKCKALHV